jgi:FkbM family methyltransferase
MTSITFTERLRRRKHRGEYRAMVKQWNADGGDDRFRFDYDLTPDSLVFDLGGYEGQWASDLYSRQRCRIHVFEPVHRFAEAIAERFRKNADISVFPVALGGSNRRESISVCGASSSAYKSKAERDEIEFRDVAEWFADHAIESIDLMKINIEGGEYELLERMIECGLASLIGNIQVQFHNFSPDAAQRMHTIQGALSRTHRPTYQYRFVWENWERT